MSELQREDLGEILEGVDEVHLAEQGLGFKAVIMGVAALVSVVAILFPKIYINSNIYYLSLEIGSLYANAKSLKEERRFLEQKLRRPRHPYAGRRI